MRRVVIESPFAGNVARNRKYLRAAMLDSLRRGEAPFASHALYTQYLDDLKPEERKLGMEAGFAWGEVADAVVVYDDLGISGGMQTGVDVARGRGQAVEFRRLPEWECRCGKVGGKYSCLRHMDMCLCTGLEHRYDCPRWELPL